MDSPSGPFARAHVVMADRNPETLGICNFISAFHPSNTRQKSNGIHIQFTGTVSRVNADFSAVDNAVNTSEHGRTGRHIG